MILNVNPTSNDFFRFYILYCVYNYTVQSLVQNILISWADGNLQLYLLLHKLSLVITQNSNPTILLGEKLKVGLDKRKNAFNISYCC